MEEVAAVRRAAEEAVADVDPEALRESILAVIGDGSVTPGALTLLAARAAGGTDAGDLDDRAAGVQLIYDGLRLTRTLAQNPPWAHGEKDAGDMDVLAADVLVARGFHRLAHTGAAGTAVEVVRAFGRDQTRREDSDDPADIDANLERDILVLALDAGATAADADVPPDLGEFAAEISPAPSTGLPAAERLVSGGAAERLRGLFRDADGDREVHTSVDR